MPTVQNCEDGVVVDGLHNCEIELFEKTSLTFIQRREQIEGKRQSRSMCVAVKQPIPKPLERMIVLTMNKA